MEHAAGEETPCSASDHVAVCCRFRTHSAVGLPVNCKNPCERSSYAATGVGAFYLNPSFRCDRFESSEWQTPNSSHRRGPRRRRGPHLAGRTDCRLRCGRRYEAQGLHAPASYLAQLGVKHIDHLYVSHYHFDHIGCIPAVLAQFPLVNVAFDRGESYPGATYTHYINAVGSHRKMAAVGDVLTLDKNSANPVVITVIAVDGQSRHGTVQTSNENDLSLAALVTFGSFREEIGGDLSGDNTQMYEDVETPVAPDVGT